MSNQKILLFCAGVSGSGKSYFVENVLPKDKFYKLKSATTRPKRKEETGNEYYFCSEEEFAKLNLVTNLFVNKEFWKPGMLKWLYGVPVNEVKEHLSQNLVYDVIQPCYIKQMIDWFKVNKLDKMYDFKIAYFVPLESNYDVVKGRANMPNDLEVRKNNTCSPHDFMDNKLDIDFLMRPYYVSDKMKLFLNEISKSK